MRHDDYETAFARAVEKSVKWNLVAPVGPLRAPNLGRARDHLALIGRSILTLGLGSQEIRLSCGQIHTWLFKNLRANGVQCILTVGDVEVAGRLEYGTSYQRLKQELRGAHRDSDHPYPFHVWLTFPDLHVIDASFFVYRFHDRLPAAWHWPDYVICSDHPFSASLDLKYVPMLVGDDLVDRMIFEQA
ncbi:MAG: hypothetical protein DYH12_11460 [Sorangiineae bacterium PRO1]|nr:hypothetical protein [Sorangiineae bacterium PRO1]